MTTAAQPWEKHLAAEPPTDLAALVERERFEEHTAEEDPFATRVLAVGLLDQPLREQMLALRKEGWRVRFHRRRIRCEGLKFEIALLIRLGPSQRLLRKWAKEKRGCFDCMNQRMGFVVCPVHSPKVCDACRAFGRFTVLPCPVHSSPRKAGP